jgi:hypothetical protein
MLWKSRSSSCKSESGVARRTPKKMSSLEDLECGAKRRSHFLRRTPSIASDRLVALTSAAGRVIFINFTIFADLIIYESHSA